MEGELGTVKENKDAHRPTNRRWKEKKNVKGRTAGNYLVKLRNLYFLEEDLGPLKGRGRTRVLQQ